jgi:hypothetical protein
MTEKRRPDGFPLTEEELSQLRRMRLAELLEGEHSDSFFEWALRDGLGESFAPTAVIGIFPSMVQGGIEPEMEAAVFDSGSVEVYLRDARGLVMPRRVLSLERFQYRDLAGAAGDQILESLIPRLVQQLMPVAVVVFSRPVGKLDNSAYLISPTLIPPTTAFRYFQQNLPVA